MYVDSTLEFSTRRWLVTHIGKELGERLTKEEKIIISREVLIQADIIIYGGGV